MAGLQPFRHLDYAKALKIVIESGSKVLHPRCLELAEKNGLDADALSTALDNSEFEPRVKKDFVSGVRSGVNGTPTFFINGRRHDGPPDFASLSAAIEAAK